MDELTAELAAAAWFESVRIRVMSASELTEESQFGPENVILTTVLSGVLHRINPDLPYHTVEEVVRILSRPPHPTLIQTDEGELAFQEYFVRRGQQDEVRGVRFPGAEGARPAPGVLDAIAQADLVLLAPSNPFVSVAPLLAVPGVRQALEAARAPRLAVSPIVGGRAVKGPAAAMLRSLGHEVSALGVARLLRGLCDVFVLDELDADLAPAVSGLGLEPLVADTMMSSRARRAALAGSLLGRRQP